MSQIQITNRAPRRAVEGHPNDTRTTAQRLRRLANLMGYMSGGSSGLAGTMRILQAAALELLDGREVQRASARRVPCCRNRGHAVQFVDRASDNFDGRVASEAAFEHRYFRGNSISPRLGCRKRDRLQLLSLRLQLLRLVRVAILHRCQWARAPADTSVPQGLPAPALERHLPGRKLAKMLRLLRADHTCAAQTRALLPS